MTRSSTLRLAFPLAAVLIFGATPVALSDSTLAGTPLSGTQEAGGHTISWSLSGASAAPAELAGSYDGVIAAGATVTFSGSATFTLGQGYVTNLSQSASLSGADSASFSDRVGGGSYTLPYSLSIRAPKATDTDKIGDVIGYVSASVSSRNCNDYGVCDGPSASLSLAVLATSSDTEKPTISLENRPDIYVDGKPRPQSNAVSFPLKLTFIIGDNSGKVLGGMRLYSGGSAVRSATTKGYVKNGRYSLTIRHTPKGPGPFYWCGQAKDKAGNYSAVKCKWLSIVVPISRVKVNGCGTAGYGPTAEALQNYFGDVREYGSGLDRTKVHIRNACNIHDAAYAGITIYDVLDKRYVDFRQWSRLEIDAEFRNDIRMLCRRDLSTPKRMAPFLDTCLHGVGLTAFVALIPIQGLAALDEAGANTYFDMVRAYGGVGFDTNATVPGTQPEMPNRTFPPGGVRNNT
ncbi:MAG: hypothetical protein MUE31_02315 [Candidatus Nanopelagicales bacterium]|nr:hypothetical protein [Candidatus Nanopelagicales bacterium]